MKISEWKLAALVLFSTSILVALIFIWQRFPSANNDAVLMARDLDIISGQAGLSYNEAVPISVDDLDRYYSAAASVPEIGKIKGGIIPHHDIAGAIPAAFFRYLEKQKPSLIVLIGPNHYNRGGAVAISTRRDWKTLNGILKTDKIIIDKLAAAGQIKVDEDVMDGDYSLSNIVPYIKRSLPDATIVPIMLSGQAKAERLDRLAAAISPLLPTDAVIVGSADFSHYQMPAVANFHDETAVAAIVNFDYKRLFGLDVDAATSIYTVLKLLEARGAQRLVYSFSQNSADLTHDPAERESVSYYASYFTDGEKTGYSSASLLNFGDIMLDRNVAKVIAVNGADHIFEILAGKENRFFAGIDAVGANLEGPFANSRRPTSKSIAFRFDPNLIMTLKKYNLTTLSCANNHSYDMGSEGFAESLSNLAKAGVDCYGAQYQADKNSILRKKIGNLNLAFVGLNDTNSRLDLEKISQIVREAKQGADRVVVNIHWGDEYKPLANARQRELARELVDAGADAVIGHHPHVVEEMEIYKNRPIFYSLGNFIFDQYFSEETQAGLAVGLVFYENKISVYVYPLKSVKSQPRQMDYAEGLNYIKNWQKSARGLTGEFVDYHLDINY